MSVNESRSDELGKRVFGRSTCGAATSLRNGNLAVPLAVFTYSSLRSSQTTTRDLVVDIPIFGGLIFNHVTGPGWVMAGCWLLQLLCIVFYFKEPKTISPVEETDLNGGEGVDQSPSASRSSLSPPALPRTPEPPSITSDESIATPTPKIWKSMSGDAHDLEDPNPDEEEKQKLLPNDFSYGATDSPTKTPPNEPSAKSSRPSILFFSLPSSADARSALAFLSEYGGLVFSNRAFPISLALFCLIELTDEILINSVSLITRRYFRWHGAAAGIFTAGLGVFVLPANFVVDKLSGYYDERSLVRFFLYFCMVGVIWSLNFQNLLGFDAHDDR